MHGEYAPVWVRRINQATAAFRDRWHMWRVADSPAAHIVEISQMIPEVRSKRRFLTVVDDFTRDTFQSFVRGYGSRAYAKLTLLKIANLLVSRHAYHHRHTQLVAQPIQLLLDPANTCQLQCPACVHSVNAGKKGWMPDWPKGIMDTDRYDRIIRAFGPFAVTGVFYNYGEPLINPQFPGMVRRAKNFGLFAMTSSNLSLRFDVDALVGSGLDRLLMSIDGASQETLGQYRRRARWELCLDNMRKLVEAKRRLGKRRPHLVWQYLTFEHNLDEVPKALELAKEIGVDELHVATPFDVSWDVPTIHVATSPLKGRHDFTDDKEPLEALDPARLQIDEDVLDRAFAQSWVERMEDLGIAEEPSRRGQRTCDWLYENITFDSHGRAMPCCMAPGAHRNLVFSSLSQGENAIVNSKHASSARLFFADREAYQHARADSNDRETYCVKCSEKGKLFFARWPNVFNFLLNQLDGHRVLSRSAAEALTAWTGD